MNKEPILTMEELISVFEQQAIDVDLLYSHLKEGTIEILYKNMIEQAVTNIMLLPLYRHERDLPQIEDLDEVSDDIMKIAEIIAFVCDKTPKMVEQDMMEVVHQFPSEDLKQANFLRRQNLLN